MPTGEVMPYAFRTERVVGVEDAASEKQDPEPRLLYRQCARDRREEDAGDSSLLDRVSELVKSLPKDVSSKQASQTQQVLVPLSVGERVGCRPIQRVQRPDVLARVHQDLCADLREHGDVFSPRPRQRASTSQL
eukprot:289889-Hanusia_phi.AAC.1